MLRHDTIFATPIRHLSLNIKDNDDLIIISAALAADSDIFVTGDKELLAIGKIHYMEILSPRAFWEKIKV
jgi:predicted nucleic acid-binding protein